MILDSRARVICANEALRRFIGDDSLNPGSAVTWLVPTTTHSKSFADLIDHSTQRGHERGENLVMKLDTATSSAMVRVTTTPLSIDDTPVVLVTVGPVDTSTILGTALEQHFRTAFEENMAPMMFTDLNDCIIDVNRAFCQMIGWSEDELIGSDSAPFTHPEDVGISEDAHHHILLGDIGQSRYVKRYLHKDGSMVIAEVSKTPARDEHGQIVFFIVSERDITEEQSLSEQLSHQALHDALTGLANRSLFDDRLRHAQTRIRRHDGYCALMMIDLDDFKGVNDAYGHIVGDEILIEVARRMIAISRSTDTLCRFGGDEFMYLAEGLSSPHEANAVADRLLSIFEQPFEVGDNVLSQRASMGMVIWDAQSAEETAAVRDADAALYEAKHLGKGRHSTYAPGMHEATADRYSLEQDLRKALNSEQLTMHYQPIVNLISAKAVGFEALMRWNHPERGWIPPNVFIPLAEESNLIVDLGEFALREAIHAASSWRASSASEPDPFITVNFSPRQFQSTNLVGFVKDQLVTSGLPAHRLMIEITEGVALFAHADALSTMSQLRHLGVNIALDDFGTGFSSLSYLARIDPSIIKIDQSFVRHAPDAPQEEKLLETIVSIGHNLEIVMVAEGIETTTQLRRLRLLNCTLGQGFLFSPAVPESDTSTLLSRIFDV